jgi:hypothetical protein
MDLPRRPERLAARRCKESPTAEGKVKELDMTIQRKDAGRIACIHRFFLTAILVLAACFSGCQSPAEYGRRSQAVLNGTPSAVEAAVLVIYGSTEACGGAVVGPRHVLTVDFCANPNNNQVIVGASLANPDFSTVSAEVIYGPVIYRLNAHTIQAAIVVTEDDLPVAPIDLADATPVVDETLTLVGYGNASGQDQRTEGTIRVTQLVPYGFDASGEGGIELCPGDAFAYDSAGRLAGLPLFGQPGTGNCVEPAIYAPAPAVRAFVEQTVGPATDPDGGVSGDGGADSDGGGGGCGCRTGTRSTPLGLIALLLSFCILFYGRRRRT